MRLPCTRPDPWHKLIWLQYLLRDLRVSKYALTILFCDNHGAISLAKTLRYHAKTKHVDVQLHFIQDHVKKGTINVEYCPTENMLADLMTKGLTCERQKWLLGLMGIGIPCEQTTTPSRIEDIGGLNMEITSGSEELHNSHGRMTRTTRTSVGASYLCYSNCDEIKSSALTIAEAHHWICEG